MLNSMAVLLRSKSQSGWVLAPGGRADNQLEHIVFHSLDGILFLDMPVPADLF